MKQHMNKANLMAACLVLAGLLIPTAAAANWVGGVTFNHPTPSYLPHGEPVEVTVDCKVTEPGGVEVYAIPYSGGAPTQFLHVSGSPVVPLGTSTTTCSFYVGNGTEIVDHVKISVESAVDASPILDFFVRVKYVYGPYGIYNIAFDEYEHSVLTNGDVLTVTCDYAAPGTDNVLVYARPFAEGIPLGDFVVEDGDEGPPTGSASQYFGSMIEDVDVDAVMLTIRNLADEVLFSVLQPVDYAWRDVGITNITFSRPIPSMVHYTDNVGIQFDYNNTTGDNIRIAFYPFEDGVFAPDGGFQGSQPVPPGEGASYRFITSVGTTHVNQVNLLVASEDWEIELVNRIIPVEFQFAPHVVTDVVVTPEPPALLEVGEWVHLDFNYRTDHTGTILIHAYPRTGGGGNPDAFATGSGFHAPPSGVGTYEFYIAEGAAEPFIDQIQFAFYTHPEIHFLGDYWVDTTYLWGDEGTVMPVPGVMPATLVRLGQNYPNPFNPLTAIPVELGVSRHVKLAVYDLRGRLVKTLADEMMGPGRHEIPFDGTSLASGQYFYRLEGAGPEQARSMMLVK